MIIHDPDEAKVAAKAIDKFRARKPVGRPSLATDTMIVVHFAVQRMTGALTQGGVMRATRTLFTQWHDTPPSVNILRRYVRDYLRWRKDPKTLAQFPRLSHQGIARLPVALHVDCLLGFAGTLSNGPRIRGTRAHAAADLTARIRALRTLPQ